MKMSFRWYGQQNESFPLQYVRQIPGVHHIVGALFDVPVGEVWPQEKIFALKQEVNSAGLAANFWSASPNANSSNNAWNVNFNNGNANNNNRSNNNHVRLVRS